MHLARELVQEIVAFGNSPADPRGREKRRTERFSAIMTAAYILIRDGVKQPPVKVVVRDISATGISIFHTDAVGEGEQFVVAIPRPAGGPLMVWCMVTRTTLIGGSLYVTGATFSRLVERERTDQCCAAAVA